MLQYPRWVFQFSRPAFVKPLSFVLWNRNFINCQYISEISRFSNYTRITIETFVINKCFDPILPRINSNIPEVLKHEKMKEYYLLKLRFWANSCFIASLNLPPTHFSTIHCSCIWRCSFWKFIKRVRTWWLQVLYAFYYH